MAQRPNPSNHSSQLAQWPSPRIFVLLGWLSGPIQGFYVLFIKRSIRGSLLETHAHVLMPRILITESPSSFILRGVTIVIVPCTFIPLATRLSVLVMVYFSTFFAVTIRMLLLLGLADPRLTSRASLPPPSPRRE